MSEKRRSQRVAMCVSVEVTTPEGDIQVLSTRDLSDGGLFLEGIDTHALGLGEELTLKVSVALQGDAAPIVKARVVRETDDGVGVCFIAPASQTPDPEDAR